MFSPAEENPSDFCFIIGLRDRRSVIANTLKELDVAVTVGIIGVPVSKIAEQAIAIGVRFIGFHNEQSAF